MPDLPEALGDALRRRYRLAGELKSPVTSRTGIKARLNRIQKAYGGNRRTAARAAGIPYSTWGHMMSGKRATTPKNVARLEAAYARIITNPYRAAVVMKKGYPRVWSIAAVVVADPQGQRYKNRKRDGPANEEGWRKFRAEGLDGPTIVDAWLSDGDAAAADALVTEVEQVYGGGGFGFEGDHVTVELTGRA